MCRDFFWDINSISLCFHGKGLKFASVMCLIIIYVEGNWKTIARLFPRFSLSDARRTKSGSCGGVRGGLINTCQSEKLWNEEEDRGLGEGGPGSQMMLNRERSRYGDIKWRRERGWEQSRRQDEKVHKESPPADSSPRPRLGTRKVALLHTNPYLLTSERLLFRF